MKTKMICDSYDPKIWKAIDSYPGSLKAKFEGIKEGLQNYINDGYSISLYEKYHFDRRFWKSFYKQVSNNQSLELSFRKARGFQSDIGFEWCKYKIKLYYHKTRKFPKYSRIPLFNAMKYACIKGVFIQYSISNWDDLLKAALPDVEIRSLKGLEGLKRAQNFLVDYYSREGRLPTLTHTSFNLIASAIKKKYWSDFNIESWKDLLFYVFGKNTVPGYSKGTMGFNKALEEIKTYFEKNGRIPRTGDFTCMQGVIRRGYWEKFKIRSWNDILKHVFGIVNHPTFQEKKEFFQFIRKKLIKYYEETKMLPTCPKFRLFEHLISIKKYWVKYGISNWNDLLMDLFGRVNTEGISVILLNSDAKTMGIT